jgi:hypothetical protein
LRTDAAGAQTPEIRVELRLAACDVGSGRVAAGTLEKLRRQVVVAVDDRDLGKDAPGALEKARVRLGPPLLRGDVHRPHR